MSILKFFIYFSLICHFPFSSPTVTGIVTLQIEKIEDGREKHCSGKTH